MSSGAMTTHALVSTTVLCSPRPYVTAVAARSSCRAPRVVPLVRPTLWTLTGRASSSFSARAAVGWKVGSRLTRAPVMVSGV